MGALATIGSVIGGVVSAIGTIAAAEAEANNLEFQAKQMEIKGKEEQAAAFFESEQYRKEKELAQSSLQARGAASGFTATDPTTLQIGSDIEKYGTLQQMMAAYGGASRREGLHSQAEANYAMASARRTGGALSAMGGLFGSIFSGFSGGSFGSSGGSNYRYSGSGSTPHFAGFNYYSNSNYG